MTERPNVILIVADQWRADCLGSAGHPVVRTPGLDRLAQRGTVFESAYSATPTCVPARVSLMLGQTVRTHGRLGYRDKVPFTATHGGETLAASFTRGGYQTRCIGKLHVWPERDRIGFEEVELHDGYLHVSRGHDHRHEATDDYLRFLREREGPSADYLSSGLHCNTLDARPWQYSEHSHPSSWVIERAVEFVERRDPTVPFFLNLSFHRPHPPLDPPQWAWDRYAEVASEMPAVPRGNWRGDYAAWRVEGETGAKVGRLRDDDLRRARVGYYGLMTHIDLLWQRFSEVLGEHGLLDNTIVLFTADHGEMLGDHDLTQKGLPYEGSARVPFVLVDPRYTQPTHSRELVDLADVMPTLLDLAGLPVPESCDGRSLARVVRGGTGVGSRVDSREFLRGEHEAWGFQIHFIRDHRFKYVLLAGPGTEQLFDLHDDPDETTCLLRAPGGPEPDHLAARDRLREALRRELAYRPDEAAAVPQ
ncbi:arylsulfatase [Micrococcales bacterium 31B]|nr:arylsulfatase [Micrococcales bacterium 31B]